MSNAYKIFDTDCNCQLSTLMGPELARGLDLVLGLLLPTIVYTTLPAYCKFKQVPWSQLHCADWAAGPGRQRREERGAPELEDPEPAAQPGHQQEDLPGQPTRLTAASNELL